MNKGTIFYSRLTLCAAVFISIMLVGCDDNDTASSPIPTAPPGCLDASSNSNILGENSECPTAALVEMCNSFICDIETSDQAAQSILFQSFTCEALDCFDFTCMVRDFENSVVVIGSGEFNIESVTGNAIFGTGLLTDDLQNTAEFNYSCSPIVN